MTASKLSRLATVTDAAYKAWTANPTSETWATYVSAQHTEDEEVNRLFEAVSSRDANQISTARAG